MAGSKGHAPPPGAGWTALTLVLCTCGIYGAYLTQGVVSELLSTTLYGVEKERFPSLSVVNGAQAQVCFMWAGLLLLLLPGGEPGHRPPWWSYWKPAVSNAIGPALGILSLHNISYSAQVLAKSCKMIPVMAIGAFLHRKHYGASEWACVSAISAGIAVFAAKSSSAVASKLVASNPALGYCLCFLNLTFDGYTNAMQDDINRRYTKSSPVHMMTWMNFWVSVYYTAFMAVTGRGLELLDFCGKHPLAAAHLMLYCTMGALGQLVIFYTIKRFGSLITTMVCTTRKFFNILISVVFQGSALLPQQWLGVVLVFAGLITTTLARNMKKKPVLIASKRD